MGVVSSVIFAARNTDKCIHKGDTTRGAVALCQSVSSLDGVANSTSSLFSGLAKGTGSVLEHADGAIESVFSRIGGEAGTKVLEDATKLTGAGTKIGALAQSAVNPLLCVAAGVRVAKDDDQYAALIEETAAMGAMFGCESVMKFARNSVTSPAKQATKGLSGKVASVLGKSEKITSVAKKAHDWYSKLGATEGGSTKQMLVRFGIDLLFVCGSILAFNLGHKAGEALSHRNQET